MIMAIFPHPGSSFNLKGRVFLDISLLRRNSWPKYKLVIIHLETRQLFGLRFKAYVVFICSSYEYRSIKAIRYKNYLDYLSLRTWNCTSTLLSGGLPGDLLSLLSR